MMKPQVLPVSEQVASSFFTGLQAEKQYQPGTAVLKLQRTPGALILKIAYESCKGSNLLYVTVTRESHVVGL